VLSLERATHDVAPRTVSKGMEYLVNPVLFIGNYNHMVVRYHFRTEPARGSDIDGVAAGRYDARPGDGPDLKVVALSHILDRCPVEWIRSSCEAGVVGRLTASALTAIR